MNQFTDQLGNMIVLEHVPQRIISLVPSQTELLYDLGLDAEVIGITKFCVHPRQWFNTKARVGGTKTVNIEKVKALKPDLIIANKEENVAEQVAELSAIAPVWTSDISNLEQATGMINSIGEMLGRSAEAEQINSDIRSGFQQLTIIDQRNTAYLVWKDPYMTVGGDTFINDMMRRCGMLNAFALRDRYPEVGIHELIGAGCRLVILSSEPYPFKQQHVAEIQALMPGVKVIPADGEMFSWYGSRLRNAPGYLNRLLADL
jgi:ABC-type Fe3+-hydroxamate transport system substrate-binding protein